MDDAFGHWLAGFLDGEGHFGIERTKGSHRCRLQVNLRWDDEPLLRDIIAVTGWGEIYPQKCSGRDQPQVRWSVEKKPEVLELADALDRFPLRSKKSRDFAVWREGVGVWQTVRGGSGGNPEAQARLAVLRERLLLIRRADL